jgi:hypothetical protein
LVTAPDSPEEAAARLEEIAPGYLDRIRRRAAELGVPKTPLERARRAVDLVTETSHINPAAPAGSSRRSGRVLKQAVGRLTYFYVRFIADQVVDLGESTSWMGSALCDYVAGLEVEVASLKERVARLEQASARS